MNDHSAIRQQAIAANLPVADWILSAIRKSGIRATLLAVCPNSRAVTLAAMEAARDADAPLLYAATLNQVDTDGGYTTWTPAGFVAALDEMIEETGFTGPVIPCLDHGGPWLRDRHTREAWDLPQTMAAVKESMVACLEAGYDLLHVDPTVDRTLPPDTPLAIETVAERTLELIEHVETHRRAHGLLPIAYEVGTEEVHGGLADMRVFRHFLTLLKQGLAARNLHDVWPCFVVGKVGTDLATTVFDPQVARELVAAASEFGSAIKGHYTDYVENPIAYPASGLGGANVGPEFTEEEYHALMALCAQANDMGKPAALPQALKTAVLASGRWKKWLEPDEQNRPFDALSSERQEWLIRTGCRYIWTAPEVQTARAQLAEVLSDTLDAEQHVRARIAKSIAAYYDKFGLVGLNEKLGARYEGGEREQGIPLHWSRH